MDPQSSGSKRRSVGDFVRSGDFSRYWETAISCAAPGKILVRGYRVEDLIQHLTYVESAWLLVRGELPSEREAKLLDLVLRSGMDQQFINAAVCAARFTASAFPESPIPALASGILATGSVTGSPQQCAEMLAVAAQRRTEGQEIVPCELAREWLARRGYVPGLGHPIHKTAEPRAEMVRRLAQQLDGWGPSGELLEGLAHAVAELRQVQLPINLAGAIAAVMVDLGWHPLEIGALGALGYGAAIVAHIVEEIRRGVPLRIIPDALGARYSGPPERSLPERFLRRKQPCELRP